MTFLKNNTFRILQILLWAVFVAALVIAFRTRSTTTEASGDVRIDFLKTADDADCIIMWQDGAAVMIDTGEKQDGDYILEALDKRGIKSLDYLLLTHNDKDHTGSALEIVKNVEVKCVIESPYAETNERIEKLNAYLKENGIRIMYPTHNKRINAGEMYFNIYPPNKTQYEDKNNYSIAMLLKHGSVNCLFTGDTLKKRDEELLMIDWPEIEIFKVPYHGRACSLSDELFEAVSPRYGVVTSDKADEEIIKAADSVDTKLMYTREGDVCFVSDGSRVKPVEQAAETKNE